jgi:hypothetical protein
MPLLPENSNTTGTTDNKLLQLVSTEIARDGGASLVTSLKDYFTPANMPPKRLKSMLVQATGKPKLLTFLENFPTLFQVNRQASPHWVLLLKRDFVREDELEPVEENCRDRKEKLLDKALYVLRKRQAKLERRHNNNEEENNTSKDSQEVNTPWLLKECSWNLHYYLRASGFYVRYYDSNHNPEDREVQPVDSPQWKALVLEEFESILLAEESEKKIAVESGKAWLVLVESSSSSSSPRGNGDDDPLLLVELDQLLTQLVHDDGAHQVSLELLLHRHEKLQKLLGGRDLWKLVVDHHQNDDDRLLLFQELDIVQDGKDVILQSKQFPQYNNGRMKVDAVGLFSVANTKW